MKQIQSMVIIAAVLLSTCCTRIEDDNKQTLPIPIRISSTLSKVASDQFEAGDAIGLYVVNAEKTDQGEWNPGTLQATGNHLDNIKFQYSGTWDSEKEHFWKDAQTKADFYIYYPYIASSPADITAIPFKIPSDQSSLEAFKSGEILWGKTSLASPSENAVNILTSHRTSQLAIEVVPGKGFTESSLKESISSLKINNIKCEGTLNLNDGTLTALGTASDVTPYFDGTKWNALIIPQKIESQCHFLI